MLAEQHAREPQGDLLLPDAAGAEQEEARGQRAAPDGVGESGAQGGMAVQRGEGHGRKIGAAADPLNRVGFRPSRAGRAAPFMREI